MFDYFKQAKTVEIKTLRRLADSGRLPAPRLEPRPDFSRTLGRAAAEGGLAVIAEYKRASPSQGDIALNIEPGQAARAYARAGASALSILTEKSKFKGRLAFLEQAWRGGAAEAGLPLLRKDFIFDRLQVQATASTPAAALLLIVGLTPDVEQLRTLREEAENFGLQAVVEVLNERELDLARESGAKIIQVNARDFHDLSVDLSRSLNLARRQADKKELWIAASGFSRPEQLLEAREVGYSAVLVGTSLMRGGDLAGSLAKLRAGLAGREAAPKIGGDLMPVPGQPVSTGPPFGGVRPHSGLSFQVKVCGLTRPEDFQFCAQSGAWTGFIFHPASPRNISPDQAAAIETGAATRVGVFVDQDAAEVRNIMETAGLNLAQLHGGQSPDFCREIGPERVIKVFWPQRYGSPAELAADLDQFADSAAFFLLDAGTGGGGHGRPLDLDFIRGLRPPRSWLLAGGLTAEHIRGLNPADLPGLYGFDFNSGVEEAPGLKDHQLIRAALRAVADLNKKYGVSS